MLTLAYAQRQVTPGKLSLGYGTLCDLQHYCVRACTVLFFLALIPYAGLLFLARCAIPAGLCFAEVRGLDGYWYGATPGSGVCTPSLDL